jgi:hypothetical protein
MAPYTPNSKKETAALRTLNKNIINEKVTADELETTLKDFQELDRRNWNSRTSPLIAAASLGSTSHIAKCLEKGINIDSIDLSLNGFNAIDYSIYYEKVDATKYLLDKGATLTGYNVITAIAEKNEVILKACLTTFGQQKNINLQDLLKLSIDDTTMLRQFLMKCPEEISFNYFVILLLSGYFLQAELLIQLGSFKDPTTKNQVNSLALAIQAAEKSKWGDQVFWTLYGISVKLGQCQDHLLSRPLKFGCDSASTPEEAYIIMVKKNNNDSPVTHF